MQSLPTEKPRRLADFPGSGRSSAKITLHQANGATKVLKEDLKIMKGVAIYATKLGTTKLCKTAWRRS